MWTRNYPRNWAIWKKKKWFICCVSNDYINSRNRIVLQTETLFEEIFQRIENNVISMIFDAKIYGILHVFIFEIWIYWNYSVFLFFFFLFHVKNLNSDIEKFPCTLSLNDNSWCPQSSTSSMTNVHRGGSKFDVFTAD